MVRNDKRAWKKGSQREVIKKMREKVGEETTFRLIEGKRKMWGYFFYLNIFVTFYSLIYSKTHLFKKVIPKVVHP